MKRVIPFLSILLLISCNSKKSADNLVIQLADSYLNGYIIEKPDFAFRMGITMEDHSGFTSNRIEDIKAWEIFEDNLYNKLLEVDESRINEKSNRITYWNIKENLEREIEFRICKRYLWDIDHWYGKHILLTNLAESQPVGDNILRQQAINRWGKIPGFFNTEIDNLKSGLSQGYSMPKEIVQVVIDQLQALQDYEINTSPFMSPANRDNNEEFNDEWKKLIQNKVLPALKKYQHFLAGEYLNNARDEVSILALPNGEHCYNAYVRKYTSLSKTGREIYELGKKVEAKYKAELITIGNQMYNSDDFGEILKLSRQDSSKYFKTSDEVLQYSEHSLSRAKRISRVWFEKLPSQEVKIKPYEPHESGIGAYEKAIGNKPPYFRISLSNPHNQSRGYIEKLTFHETYPGHHLQYGLAKEIEGLHPINNLFMILSFIEGWARYSEQLAEEMELYNDKTAKINRRVWPARGMVVDPGLHLYGWTKEQVIEYIVEGGFNENTALGIYYRIISWPAQLTSYDSGGEEFKALRRLAEEQLGDKFNVAEFHSKLLEHGSIPLSSFRTNIEEWISNNK